MDTSYSIRLGIEDQAAVEKAFAAIGEAGKTALATVQGAAGTASNGLGSVSDGASEIAHGFDVVSASSTGLATALGVLGLPQVAVKALALAEAAKNVATALRTAGGAAGIASSALSLLADSQHEQAEAAQAATDDIAALAEAQADHADAQGEQADAARTATDDIQAMAAAQGELEEKSGTSLTTVLAWAASIAAAAGVVYLAYKTVETGVDLAGDAISALADIAGAEALRRLDEQAIEAYRHQEDLARELGVTAASLKAVASAADELGVSQDQATSIARHLIEMLDDQSGKSDLARATLKAYGVEIDGLTGKDWATVLDGWSAAMQGVADSAAKTKANLVVLGSDGTTALHGLSTAGSVTSAESERLATLTAELERRVSASLQRQAELAEQPSWFEKLVDRIDDSDQPLGGVQAQAGAGHRAGGVGMGRVLGRSRHLGSHHPVGPACR